MDLFIQKLVSSDMTAEEILAAIDEEASRCATSFVRRVEWSINAVIWTAVVFILLW